MKIRTDQIFLIAALFCLIGQAYGHRDLTWPFWVCLLGFWLT